MDLADLPGMRRRQAQDARRYLAETNERLHRGLELLATVREGIQAASRQRVEALARLAEAREVLRKPHH